MQLSGIDTMKYHTKWESDKNQETSHTRVPAGDLNAARNRQDSITKTNLKYK